MLALGMGQAAQGIIFNNFTEEPITVEIVTKEEATHRIGAFGGPWNSKSCK